MFNQSEISIRHSLTPFEIAVALGDMHERAWQVVPVVRGFGQAPWPAYARGLFVHHPTKPSLDHIALPLGRDSDEELIVLAHELGHAENCKFDSQRWKDMALAQQLTAHGVNPGRYGEDLLIIEEMKANERGRKHMTEICSGLVDEFDRQMNMSVLAFIVRLGKMKNYEEFLAATFVDDSM